MSYDKPILPSHPGYQTLLKNLPLGTTFHGVANPGTEYVRVPDSKDAYGGFCSVVLLEKYKTEGRRAVQDSMFDSAVVVVTGSISF